MSVFGISSDPSSMQSLRDYTKTNHVMSNNFERVSSGLRINKSVDDGAGFAISNRMSSTQNDINQSKNLNVTISEGQVINGNLIEISNTATRMKSIAVETSSRAIDGQPIGMLQDEYNLLAAELEMTFKDASFEGNSIFKTNDNGEVSLNSSAFKSNTTLSLQSIPKDNSQTTTAQSDTTVENDMSSNLDTLFENIKTMREDIGGQLKQYEDSAMKLNMNEQNASPAQSRIRDADFANQTASINRNERSQQMSVSLLSNAHAGMNQMGALALLG